MDGGDGDQSYFSEPMELEVVDREWFKPETPHGPAKLTQVLSGRHLGEYVALTSRVLSNIDEAASARATGSEGEAAIFAASARIGEPGAKRDAASNSGYICCDSACQPA